MYVFRVGLVQRVRFSTGDNRKGYWTVSVYAIKTINICRATHTCKHMFSMEIQNRMSRDITLCFYRRLLFVRVILSTKSTLLLIISIGINQLILWNASDFILRLPITFSTIRLVKNRKLFSDLR